MSHSQRLPLIDLLKVVASQLIVLHHLAFYGPMADHAAPLMPRLIDWLADPARMVVQVFLVVGGYLAALSLAPDGRVRTPTRVTSRLLERYLRLALPLTLALLLAIVAAAVARNCMEHPSVPVSPSPMQFFAHLLLLQDVIGKEALSAGIWYVAIDLQLYAALVLWLALVVALLKRPDRVRQVLGCSRGGGVVSGVREPAVELGYLGPVLFCGIRPGRACRLGACRALGTHGVLPGAGQRAVGFVAGMARSAGDRSITGRAALVFA